MFSSCFKGNYETVIGDDESRYEQFKREMQDETQKHAPNARVINVRSGSIIVDVHGSEPELVRANNF